MRKIFLFILITSPWLLAAQSSTKAIQVVVNEGHSGLHIGVDFRYALSEKYTFYAGINYLGNRVITDNQFYYYKHRFYAQNAAEHFGLRLGGERQFTLKKSSVKPLLFVQIQQTRASIRQNFQQVGRDSSSFPPNTVNYYCYEDYRVMPKAVLSIESTFGAGFIADLSEKLAVQFRGGVSVPVIIDPNMNRYSIDGLNSLVEAGLIWRFNKTAP
jgi:hypothetical protein